MTQIVGVNQLIWKIVFLGGFAFVTLTSSIGRAEEVVPMQAQRTVSQQEVFIKGFLKESLEVLKKKEIAPEERKKQFRSLFEGKFYVKGIAASALRPREAQIVPKEDLEIYKKFFIEMVLSFYMKQLEQLSLEGFHILTVREGEDAGWTVETSIDKSGSPEPYKVAWILYKKDEGLYIFDVIVDGVSLANVQKQKIQDLRQGQDFPELLNIMKKEFSAS